MERNTLAGVYAAAVTPLKDDYSVDLESLLQLLKFLAKSGCHGALLSGTTGEGPSFNTAERQSAWQFATKIKEEYPDFRLIAGTGSPSLQQTIDLNKIAFDLGFEAVLTLPPYYFRKASDQGLYQWFSEVINQSVPEDGWLLGYQIPQVSGIGFSLDLLSKLRDHFPNKFAGIKDSTGDLNHAKEVSAVLNDRLIFIGNDRLFDENMKLNASGCITAMANLISPALRAVWDAHLNNEPSEILQEKLNQARSIGEKYQPFPSSLKALLKIMHGFPQWAVKPPLMPFPEGLLKPAAKELSEILEA